MHRASIYDARNSLSSLIRQAESGELVELTRHEKPVAVLLGYGEYQKNYQALDWFQNLRRNFVAEAFGGAGEAGQSCATEDCLGENEGLPFVRSQEKPDLERIESLWSFVEEN